MVRFISRCIVCFGLTVVFLLEESPELVGPLLGCVLILGQLALLLFWDQLKYGLRERRVLC